MSRYVASYDISDDRRRRAVARALGEYGFRVQESVFEVLIEPEEIREFKLKVGMILASSDHFDLYPIDDRVAWRRLRWCRPVPVHEPVLLL